MKGFHAKMRDAQAAARKKKNRETLGRIFFVGPALPEGSVFFRDSSFQIIESYEVLDLSVSVHAYEELVVHKTVIVREEVVATILRRENAEIDIDGTNVTAATAQSTF